MIKRLLSGEALSARALRGVSFALLGYGGSQFLRLASNLILTRLLFPEAFGLMALVSVFMVGIAMFSDLGVTPGILQSKRGDDPEFLNTAWTIQVIRGFGLWVTAAVLAWPMAQFYAEPQLTALIPAAAFTLVIIGFNPTSVDTANRHLLLGRVTLIDLATQVIGILVAVWAAWMWQSVWALVLSGLVAAIAQLFAYSRFLPGGRNRFRWEREAAAELIGFGKWIFLSTVAGFLYSQGDRAVLGKYLSIDVLGIYNLGYFMASFPMMLGFSLVRKVMIPLYRERPPAGSRANFLKHRRLRGALTFGLLVMSGLLAFLGVWLIDLLYDPRYQIAGAVVVLIASAQMLPVISLTYDQAALASGDSRRFFVLAAAKALFMMVCLLIGAEVYGLFGAIAGQAVAMALVYPVTVWLALKQGAWDPLHDLIMTLLALVLAGIAITWNWAAILGLMAF